MHEELGSDDPIVESYRQLLLPYRERTRAMVDIVRSTYGDYEERNAHIRDLLGDDVELADEEYDGPTYYTDFFSDCDEDLLVSNDSDDDLKSSHKAIAPARSLPLPSFTDTPVLEIHWLLYNIISCNLPIHL